MTYVDPKTYTTGEVVSAADMNTYQRDNIKALKDPPTASYLANETSDYTTLSTTFVDIDAATLSLTITTTGGDVLVGFVGNGRQLTANQGIYYDVTIDGVRVAGDAGLTFFWDIVGINIFPVSFVYLATDLAAGEHTFRMQWKVSAGSAELFAGTGSSTVDVHPQFWVKEL